MTPSMQLGKSEEAIASPSGMPLQRSPLAKVANDSSRKQKTESAAGLEAQSCDRPSLSGDGRWSHPDIRRW